MCVFFDQEKNLNDWTKHKKPWYHQIRNLTDNFILKTKKIGKCMYEEVLKGKLWCTFIGMYADVHIEIPHGK